MTLNDLILRVAARTNKNANDTAVKARLINHVNDECQDKWDGYAWSFRWSEYLLALTADVTTGTATATASNTTVTFSSAVLDTTAHVGAFVRFTGDSIQNWYRIRSIASTTVCTIEPAYQGTTGSLKTYELKKSDYLFPSELADMGSVQISYMGIPVTITSSGGISNWSQPPLYKGPPQVATLYNPDFIGASYTTGTITGTINTNTLTGVGTAWLANLTAGDTISVSTDTDYYGIANRYTIYKVNSDTSIVLYQNLQKAATAASYTATRQFGRYIRFAPTADNPYVINVKGLRKYAFLINNNDTNMLLYRFPTAVEEGAVRRELASSPDTRESATLKYSDLAWQRARSEDAALTPRNNTVPIYNPRLYGSRRI